MVDLPALAARVEALAAADRCSICLGTGKIWHPREGWRGRYAKWCSVCSGTGRQPANDCLVDPGEPTYEEMCEPGRVTWHSSGLESGPDVGISYGLGDGKTLWAGEITDSRWGEVADEVPDFGPHGWWLMIYPDGMPLAKFVDAEAARGFIDTLTAAALRARAMEAGRG